MFISIEIGADSVLFRFDGQKNITIENLTFKYTGGHAVRGSNTENITVRNCEIGYVGGSYLDGYGDGKVRYGNGIELMSNSKNTLLENTGSIRYTTAGYPIRATTALLKTSRQKTIL